MTQCTCSLFFLVIKGSATSYLGGAARQLCHVIYEWGITQLCVDYFFWVIKGPASCTWGNLHSRCVRDYVIYTHTRMRIHSHKHTHTHTHTHTHANTLFHTHTRACTLSLSLSHTHTPRKSGNRLSPKFVRFLTCYGRERVTHIHAHTRTYTCTPTHTRTHTCTP